MRGLIAPRDFMVSSTTAGISLHEQVRRANTVDELCQRARRLPAVVTDLLTRGLDAGNMGVRRRQLHGLLLHPDYDPNAIVDNKFLPFDKLQASEV